MPRADHHVAFTISQRRYAIRLLAVDQVVSAVEISGLPKAPSIVSGVINVQGQIVPVINVRKRFGLEERDLALSDQMIIAHTSMRRVALVVDEVNGLIECPEDRIVTAAAIVPGMEYVKGIVKLADDMILIHDLDEFLSLEEENSLLGAMESL